MKKIIFLLAAIFCAAFTTTVHAEFSDVPDEHQYRDAITTLAMLETSSGDKIINGYEDGTFKPEGDVTRAEFAKIITSALNYTPGLYSDSLFTDTSEHWAKDYINTCAGLGIINGMGDGTFAPDSLVTYEQALKMVVCTLGYGDLAESQGGYPAGYTSQASGLGLLDNITNLKFPDNAPRGVAAQIVYNALEVNIAEKSGAGITITDKTILSDRLNVEKLRGTLVGAEDYITEDCTERLSRGMIDILGTDGREYVMDYRSFSDSVSGVSKYLGQTITVYYRNFRDIDGRELIAIDDETVRNNSREVFSGTINSYNGSQLKYYDENGKADTLNIDADTVSVRYNGKLIDRNGYVTITDDYGDTETLSVSDALCEWLDPDSRYFMYGTLRAVDNRADGKIDMAEIYDYKILVAYAKPTASDYRIQDKLKTAHSLILDPGAPNYSYSILRNGSAIDTVGISANDVLLYAQSLDGELYTVYDTNSPVTGTIESVRSDTSAVTINGKEYTISDECLSYMENNSIRDLKVGVSGTFYIDRFGTIAFVTLSAETAIPYAYIASATYERGDAKGYITAYIPSSDSSTAKVYTMSSKIKIDGSSMRPADAVDYLSETSANSNKDADKAKQIYVNGNPSFSGTAQIARIRLNSDKEVTEIITLSDDEYDDNGDVVENTKNEDTSKIVRARSLGKYYYTSNSFKESSSSTSTLFTTNSSTTVIFIPMNRGDSRSYTKKAPSSAFTSGESYYVEAYDVNNSRTASLVLLYGTNGAMTKVSRTTDFSVVASNPDSIYNEDTDSNALEISVFRGATNSSAKWTTYDDTEFADIVTGDVIQFGYDNDKLVQGLVKNISFNDIANVLDDTGGDVLYNWNVTQSPDESNNYQSYLFDYRFKALNSSDEPIWDEALGQYRDESYTSSSLGTVPYLRAYMANVSQVLIDENKIYVTKNGFVNENGEWTYDESDYEELSVPSSTKIIRMESDRRGFSKYVDGTETTLTYTDLRDAQNYGTNCSKVLICTLRGAVRLIAIYE